MMLDLNTLFLLLAVISAMVSVATRDLLAAVIVFGAFSFFSAMYFAGAGALDVAFTEAAVGAAIATVLFVTVIHRTDRSGARQRRRGRRFVLAAAGVGIVLAFALAGFELLRASLDLPVVGDPRAPAARHVSPRYIEMGPQETGATNMVTGVLADYRSFDTLGETVVIFAGGLACFLIMGAHLRPEAFGDLGFAFGSPVLDTAVRLLTPFILLFAAYVVGHGHHSPGGGFQGGVILAAALILVHLVLGPGTRWRLHPPGSLALAALGLALYIGVGILGVAFGSTFLDYGVLPLGLAPSEVRAVGSFTIEVGVALTVMGVLVLIFDALMAWE